MDLLRMILIWLGILDEGASGTMDDNGSGQGGGNSSIAFDYTTKGRANAPAASFVHHPGVVGWVGKPHRGRGRFKVRLRYDSPEDRATALNRLSTDGSLLKVTVPVIPRSASARTENPPAEVSVRW